MERTPKVIYPIAMTALDYAALKFIAANRGITNAEAIRRLIREAVLRECPDVLADNAESEK